MVKLSEAGDRFISREKLPQPSNIRQKIPADFQDKLLKFQRFAIHLRKK
jgi:hypothetical protein